MPREGLFTTNHGRHLEAVDNGTEYVGGIPFESGDIKGNVEGRAFNGSAMVVIVGGVGKWSFADTVDLSGDQCHEIAALFSQMGRACDRHELVADLEGDA